MGSARSDPNAHYSSILIVKNKKNCSEASTSFYQEENLDLDSWFQIAQIDYEKLIEVYPFQEMFTAFGKVRINLLDIGCGTSKFPSLLDSHIPGDIHFFADLLDASEYCLEKSQQVLTNLNNFTVNKVYLADLQNIDLFIPATRKYDLIWAMHAVYGIDKNSIRSTIKNCLELLSSRGKLLIYMFPKDSFYYKIYDLYLQKKPKSAINCQQFITTEDFRESLELLGLNYQSHEISFDHIIDNNRQQLLEAYLKKCVLDGNADLTTLFQEWLPKYLDKDSNQYKFPQIVNLLTIENREI